MNISRRTLCLRLPQSRAFGEIKLHISTWKGPHNFIWMSIPISPLTAVTKTLMISQSPYNPTKCSGFISLAVSAAFDTVDHLLLLEHFPLLSVTESSPGFPTSSLATLSWSSLKAHPLVTSRKLEGQS